MLNDIDLNNIITFENVGKSYSPKDVALVDVNFTVSVGQFICLIGASGSGKTTILKIIAGLEKETSGKVIKPEAISMSFQSAALFPWLSSYDNIAFALRAKGWKEDRIKKQVEKYAEMMGLSDYLNKRSPELSGGQKQRVGIARALAVEPAVLLLDEPFSALDPKTTDELHNDILKLWRETGKTIVLVSHLIEEAVSLGEKVLLIKDHTKREEFEIKLPYPRREQGGSFQEDVMKIRKVFFE